MAGSERVDPDDGDARDSRPGGRSHARGILRSIEEAYGLGSSTGGTDEPDTPQEPDPPRYRIGPEIARGGMGAILEVRDSDLRRSLAMKVLLGGSGAARGLGGPVEPEHLRRFLEEAQITAQLAHPGVVPVHELGMDDRGRVYFTMGLVQGRTLGEVFRLARGGEEGWSRTRALQSILRVCETMAFAHERGVIHRDIKPDNVMVGRFGETYVMDWGLAKVLDHEDLHDIRPRQPDPALLSRVESSRSADAGHDSPVMTMDGAVVGTPAYMPPEQARGDAEAVNRRSDVYAIGAMLYDLLAGHAPYVEPGTRVSPAMVLLAVHHGPPKPLREIASDVPEELIAICERAMARERDERYATALELAEDIRAFLEGRVVRAYRTGTLVELRKWIGRNRGTAAAMAVAVLALIAGLAVSLVLGAEARRREEASIRQAYRSSVAAASVELATHNVAAARGRLDQLPERLRGWEWRHLWSRLDGSTSEVAALQFAVLPDGRVYVATPDGGVSELDPESGATTPVHGPRGRSWHTPRPPLGSQVFLIHQEDAHRVIDPVTGEEMFTIRGESVTDFPPLVTATRDGSWLAWEEQDAIHVLDRRSGQKGSWAAPGRMPGVVSGDGRLLAVFDPHMPGVDVVRRESREIACVIAAHPRPGAVGFSPDGSRLAVGDVLVLRVFDTSTGAPADWRSAGGFTNVISAVSFSDDGTMLAAASDRSIRLLDARTGDTTQVLPGDAVVDRIEFSRDGRWLLAAYANDRLRAWSVGARREPHVLTGHASFVYGVAFTPDGQRIVSGGWDGYATRRGCIRVWDAATGDLVAAWGPADRIVESVAVAPDGSRIFTCGRGVSDSWTRYVLEVWDAATGALLPGPEGDLSNVVLSADGRFLAAAAGRSVRLFDLATLAARATLEHAGEVDHIAFRPDGERVAAISRGGALRAWRTTDGELLTDWPAKGVVVGGESSKLAYAADGSRIFFCTGLDHAVHVAEADTGRAFPPMIGHGAAIFRVLPAPDGRRVFSGGDDNRVFVWEADSLAQIASLPGHAAYVYSLALSPDGETLASASGDGTVRLWDTQPARVRHRAIAERRRLAADLEPRVRAFFEEGRAPGEAIAALRSDPGLAGRAREVALQIALGLAVERR